MSAEFGLDKFELDVNKALYEPGVVFESPVPVPLGSIDERLVKGFVGLRPQTPYRSSSYQIQTFNEGQRTYYDVKRTHDRKFPHYADSVAGDLAQFAVVYGCTDIVTEYGLYSSDYLLDVDGEDGATAFVCVSLGRKTLSLIGPVMKKAGGQIVAASSDTQEFEHVNGVAYFMSPTTAHNASTVASVPEKRLFAMSYIPPRMS